MILTQRVVYGVGDGVWVIFIRLLDFVCCGGVWMGFQSISTTLSCRPDSFWNLHAVASLLFWSVDGWIGRACKDYEQRLSLHVSS